MKYVFFGTPRFAEIVLKGLLDAGMIPQAVVANPNRPVGRKKIVTSPRTIELLKNSKHASAIAIFQPESFDEPFIKILGGLDPDLFIVAAYAKIIPKAILDIPRFGTIGVHPSLLPKYRGSSPIQSAILNGETQTGVALYRMDEKMDHGPIVHEATVAMDPVAITYLALEAQLAEVAARALVQLIPQVQTHLRNAHAQDEARATYTKKFATQDGFVEPETLAAAERGDRETAEAILRKIHALSPEPGAWTMQAGKRVKLLEASIANGALKLSKTQKEGERAKSL